MEKIYTILIVEDEPANINILNELLKDKYNIRVANNGEKAEALIASGKIPDLILLDVVMPGKNGYEVCVAIKAMPGTKDLPVIFLSGKTETDEIVKGFKAGAVDYVTKPFQPEELLTRVETQLSLLESKKKLENMNIALRSRNQDIEKGMETARLLQRKLLPGKKLEAPWINSHFSFVPMDMVGGDFYDYSVSGNTLELFIADVAGHGLPGMIFSTIAKVAREYMAKNNSPSAVLNELNDVICNYTVEGFFITAFYCVIDISSKRLAYSSAGHCPVIIHRRQNDSIIEMGARGIPLGVARDQKFPDETVEVHSGDRIIIYTDGITECIKWPVDIFEMWGDESFYPFILNNSKAAPEEFCINLMEELKQYTGGRPLTDDLTLGVVDIL